MTDENTRKALAAQPRDDVRELIRRLRSERFEGGIAQWIATMREAADTIERFCATLSQTDEQPAIPDMTDAECATAYRDLRKRANDAGFATVGEWIDEQPDTQGGGTFALAGCCEEMEKHEARTDRKAVLEEAAKVAESSPWPDHGYQIAGNIRALAEGEGE